MAPYIGGRLELPFTDELARTNIALPMSPSYGPEQAAEVAAALASAAATAGSS